MKLADRLGAWMRANKPSSPRDVIPPRDAWLRLISSPTSYLLSFTLIATAIGKTSVAMEIHGHIAALLLAWAVLADVVVYLGLAGIFSMLEARSRWFLALSLPVSLTIAIFGALNAGYLLVAGEQGSYEALHDLYTRHKDAIMVLEESLASPREAALALVSLLTVILFPIGVFYLSRRFARGRDHRGRARVRAQLALTLAGFSALASVLTPAPSSVEGRMVGRSALVTTIRTSLTRVRGGEFAGWQPAQIVSDEEVRKLEARGAKRPNVLVVVLESTRWDHTSLAGEGAMASTPTLAALGESGLVATRARSVLPHTTKSMFSFFCGRLPTMQKGVIEVSDDARVQCLPSILRSAGYDTAFFQSAFGTFEQRPRLVEHFGFEHFEAWEDIRGQKLGYLASDDGTLVEPFAKWLDALEPGQPFMAAILTSATHHPYRLPRGVSRAARKAGRERKSAKQRYRLLVEAEDEMLAGLLSELEQRGLADDTIVVALGDHGEGFGDHGVRQHDNNFYEEGLHVPFVIAGPGVPKRTVEANVSLVDLTPTLLAVLGLTPTEPTILEGYDVLSPDFPTDQPRWFGCYADMRCRGFVLGDSKVVFVPQSDERWYFDLANDPDEREPLVLTRELERHLRELNRVIDARRTRDWTMKHDRNERYPPWLCERDQRRCRHPGAHKVKYRYGEPSAKGTKTLRTDGR